MLDQCLAGPAVSGDDVDDTGGETGFLAEFGEKQRGQGSKLGWLQDHSVPGRQRRRDLPCEHEQRKIPRDDLAYHSASFVIRKFLLEQLSPARVIVEMPRH